MVANKSNFQYLRRDFTGPAIIIQEKLKVKVFQLTHRLDIMTKQNVPKVCRALKTFDVQLSLQWKDKG